MCLALLVGVVVGQDAAVDCGKHCATACGAIGSVCIDVPHVVTCEVIGQQCVGLCNKVCSQTQQLFAKITAAGK